MAAIGGIGVVWILALKLLTDQNLTLWSLVFPFAVFIFRFRFAIRMNMFTLLSAIRSVWCIVAEML